MFCVIVVGEFILSAFRSVKPPMGGDEILINKLVSQFQHEKESDRSLFAVTEVRLLQDYSFGTYIGVLSFHAL